jgi:hypothetical protein
VYQILVWDNIKKLQNLRLTPEHHKWLKLEKHATCPENTHFIPPLSLLYNSNNYITGNRRGYEYEFKIWELHCMMKYWIGLSKKIPMKDRYQEQGTTLKV